MQRRILYHLALGCALAHVSESLGETWDDVSPTQAAVAAPRLSIAEQHTPSIRRDAEVQPEGNSVDAEPTQEEPQEERPDAESVGLKAEVESLLQTARDADTLTDENRAAIVGLLEKSLESIRVTADLAKEQAVVLEQTQALPGKLESLQAELRLPPTAPATPILQNLSLEDVDRRHHEIVDQLEAARATLQRHQAAADQLQDRRKKSQQIINDLNERKAAVQTQLDQSPAEGISESHLNARETELKTRLARLLQEEQLLKAQVDLAKASVDLHPLQSDLDRREIARLEKLEGIWQEALSAKRNEESERQIAEAKRKAREADPALRALADENAALAETRSRYADRLRRITDELRDVRDAFKSQETAFEKITSRIADVGMTEAIGLLLRTHQRQLLDDRPMRIRAREIDDELPAVELLLAETHEKRDAMFDLDLLTKQQVARLLPVHSQQDGYQMVYELLQTRRQYLSDLHADLQTYQEDLTDLHIQLVNSAKSTAAQRLYIGEHILWIRSADTVSWSDIEASKRALRELVAPSRWRQVLEDVGLYLKRHLFVWLILLALFAVGMVVTDRLKDRIETVGKSKSVIGAFRFLPTLEVTAETLAIALFLPGSMLLLSLYLTRFPEASFLELAIGVGLRWTSLMWIGLSILRQVVAPEGLAAAHFGWHPNNVRVIRQNLGLLITLGLPAVFVVTIIDSYRAGDYVASLGRLSFMGGMSVMAVFTHRLLDPYRTSNGVWAKRDVWLYRVRHLLHIVCVMIPVTLATLAAMGYVYSAHQLAFRAQLSLWLVMGVVLSQALLGRYLRIARRNAILRHSQHKREEKAESQDDIPTNEEDIDFRSIDGQVQRLLRGGTIVTLIAGGLLIWADMVPALKILDTVRLWAIQAGPLDAATGDPLLRWITLADVLLATATLVATVMSARNVPGLLNITFFERLPIDYGTRYALTAVSRYLISLIGIVCAFQFIGVTWQSVQWLVAAVTVGLGFGLQEIFANFVSGLIIFTERPVRVGDMVTVGDVTGKVTRVQIRATTITDFDRRELVVPNKRFITEDVINWTLSDPITRVILSVGISYDCDPEQAREQLLRVAKAHPMVLAEPEPTAVFVGFGDSTLDLELRVFIIGRDNVFVVQNELNLAINRAFRQANLEIAYPQRDLRIRSVDAEVFSQVMPAAKKAA